MTIESWLQSANADAERRGLPELKPLLESLAQATIALRAAKFGQSPVPSQPIASPQSPVNSHQSRQ